MAVAKHGNKHLATKVIFAEDNKEYVFNDLARLVKTNVSTAKSRWLRDGSKQVVTRELLTGVGQPKRGTKPTLVTFKPHGEVTINFIFKLFGKEIHRGYQFFLMRWNAFGRPEEATMEMFTMSNEEVEKRTGVNFWKAPRAKNGVADPKFLDPTFHPEIPFGDLQHLSARKNTGAARIGADWDNPGSLKERGGFNGYINRGGKSLPVYAV